MDEKQQVSLCWYACWLLELESGADYLHVQLSASADVMLGSVSFCFILSIMKCLSHLLISELLYQLINV